MCVYRAVERTNILGIVNLVVKGLMETSMQQGKTLNDAHPQLQQCLVAIELGLRHRLKSEDTEIVCELASVVLPALLPCKN